MCGISGIVAVDGELPPSLRAAIRPMTAAMHHRGPDGQGVIGDHVAALGHRRLAIIDREGGAQPIANEDGSCWIVFNGEIYNHRGLRERLIGLGHGFRTHSDTEAILHAYEEFGAACVPMLEGMFAFAIYDSRRRELFIARDRLGKKPLFYAELDGALHFASELRAIRESPAWDPSLDLSQLEGYLSLGYFLAPHTPYRKVKKLPPAHWLRMRNGHIEVQRYWDVERFDDHQAEGAALEEELDDLLRRAVADRLESEVPLGAFLSGGIDSGLVVSYMAEQLGRVTTTSVGFAESAHDETGAAAITAKQFNTDHHVEIVQPAIDAGLEAVVGGFDEPFADASAIPTYHVAGMARRHVTVVLSGDGGDEAFGGYDFRYVPHAVEAMARRAMPGAAGRAAAAFAAAHWPQSPRLPRPLRLATIFDNLSRDAASAYYSDLCQVKPHVARRLMGLSPLRDPSASVVYDAVTAPYRRCASMHPVQRAMYADLHIYLPNDVLVKVDRMTMQHSIEVRCPLLDHRVIELAFRIPVSRKMPALRGKHLLRQLAQRRLPPGISKLPKHGFSAPVGEWIGGPCAGRFHDEVLSPGAAVRDLVDTSEIGRLFHDHVRGVANYTSALWTVWMLARWYAKAGEEAKRRAPDAGADRPIAGVPVTIA